MKDGKEYDAYLRVLKLATELDHPGDLGAILIMALASLTAGGSKEHKEQLLNMIPGLMRDTWAQLEAQTSHGLGNGYWFTGGGEA